MFPCPRCQGKTGVKDTYIDTRRRKCFKCGTLFLTREVPYTLPKDEISPLTVKWKMNAHKLKQKALCHD